MKSISRNLLTFVKLTFHLVIIAVAVLNIVCIALKDVKTNPTMVLAYILDAGLIVANLFPFGSYSTIPNIAWLGITLIPILRSKNSNATWIIRGLVDNDVIVSYFNFGDHNDVLFYLSVACWLIVLAAFILTLLIGMWLNCDEQSRDQEEEKTGCRDINDNIIPHNKSYLEDLKNAFSFSNKKSEIVLIV